MIVNLHIERLVIDGLPVGSHEGPYIQAAVERELARLIGEGRISQGVRRSRTQALVRAETLIRPAAGGDGLGAQIGAAICQGIAG